MLNITQTAHTMARHYARQSTAHLRVVVAYFARCTHATSTNAARYAFVRNRRVAKLELARRGESC